MFYLSAPIQVVTTWYQPYPEVEPKNSWWQVRRPTATPSQAILNARGALHNDNCLRVLIIVQRWGSVADSTE